MLDCQSYIPDVTLYYLVHVHLIEKLVTESDRLYSNSITDGANTTLQSITRIPPCPAQDHDSTNL